MKKPDKKAPLAEQELCVSCGFCCDGTIFTKASLKPGEKGNLPEKMEDSYFVSNDKEHFKLPCGYFDKKCSIYNQKKAYICSAYRCQLLVDFSSKKISKEEARNIILKALEMRNELQKEYKALKGVDDPPHFQQILNELRDDNDKKDEKTDAALTVLASRCNIFEALLIKHFRSAKDFESMMVSENDKKE